MQRAISFSSFASANRVQLAIKVASRVGVAAVVVALVGLTIDAVGDAVGFADRFLGGTTLKLLALAVDCIATNPREVLGVTAFTLAGGALVTTFIVVCRRR